MPKYEGYEGAMWTFQSITLTQSHSSNLAQLHQEVNIYLKSWLPIYSSDIDYWQLTKYIPLFDYSIRLAKRDYEYEIRLKP